MQYRGGGANEKIMLIVAKKQAAYFQTASALGGSTFAHCSRHSGLYRSPSRRAAENGTCEDDVPPELTTRAVARNPLEGQPPA